MRPYLNSPLFGILPAAFLLVFVQQAQALDFKKDVQPILRKKCYKCHSGPRARAGLRMDNATYFKKKINTEPDAPIHPGHPEKSLMVKKTSLPRTDSEAMPPRDKGKPLSQMELATIKKWIREGASLEPAPEGNASSESATTASAVDMNKVYTWTNTAGKTLKAGFIKLDGETVVLKKADGAQFSYPMTNLSEESRKQAADLAAGQ